MAKQYGNIIIEQSVDLGNFTDTTGSNLYFKIDGIFTTVYPDGSTPNLEFRSIDGGIKWNYTNSYGYQPYALLQPVGQQYYLNYILSGATSGLGVISYNIEYAEDSGSIALYVNGSLSGSATTLEQLNFLIQGPYISLDASTTRGGTLTIDTNLPMIDLTDYVETQSLENEDIWKSYGIPEGAYEHFGYAPADVVNNITVNYLTGYVEDDTAKYYMYNTYASGKGTFEGFNKLGSDVIRNENIYAQEGHNLALYYTQNDNSLTLVYNNEVIRQAYHSNGSAFVDDDRNIVYTTFYNYWQGRLGNTTAASRVETNIPIFETMADANGYLGGTVSIERAINFDEISGHINPTNKTALQDIATQFSDTYHTGVFGIQLACSISALRDISNNIFTNDSEVLENIKKGLEMFGSNPIDSIIDLSYYPFDITSVVSGTVPQNYVNFGSYRAELSHSVNRLVYNNGYIDCGSVNFYPTYNSYIDYAHTSLEVYLPYIGMKQLETSLYMGHQISVRYYIDFHTRGCTACILSDGLLCDYFEGIIGISQPITATQFGDYATRTIQTLVGGATNLMNPLSSTVSGIAGGAGGIGGAAGLAVSAGINTDLTMASTVYDVVTNNAKNMTQTKGALGSDTGGHMPQYVFFRFTYEQPIEPSNLKTLYGKPSNSGGRISSYGGFLQCSVVELDCGRATASEKNEIISLLKSGIRI